MKGFLECMGRVFLPGTQAEEFAQAVFETQEQLFRGVVIDEVVQSHANEIANLRKGSLPFRHEIYQLTEVRGGENPGIGGAEAQTRLHQANLPQCVQISAGRSRVGELAGDEEIQPT